MDQNDTMDAIRKFHKTPVNQPWRLSTFSPYVQEKYGAIAFESGIYVLGHQNLFYEKVFRGRRGRLLLLRRQAIGSWPLGNIRGDHLGETLEAHVDLVAWIILSNPLRKMPRKPSPTLNNKGDH